MQLDQPRLEAVIKIALSTKLHNSRYLANFLANTTSLTKREALVYSVEALKQIELRRLRYKQRIH